MHDECDGLPEKVLNCPSCGRNDGQHDPGCLLGLQLAKRSLPRVIQIAALPEDGSIRPSLYALTNDGRIWVHPVGSSLWVKVDSPPGCRGHD